jgi:hypothetical protein
VLADARNDADHLELGSQAVVGLPSFHAHPTTEGVAARPQLLGHPAVDHGHAALGVGVAGLEEPAPEERQAQGLEVGGVHVVETAGAGRLRVLGEAIVRRDLEKDRWHEQAQARRPDAGNGLCPFLQVAEDPAATLAGVAALGDVDSGEQEVVGIEAEVGATGG